MEYKYICNNSGCTVRIVGCPIPPKSTIPSKCPFCGHEMVEILNCKCGFQITRESEFCSECGNDVKGLFKLEEKTRVHVLDGGM